MDRHKVTSKNDYLDSDLKTFLSSQTLSFNVLNHIACFRLCYHIAWEYPKHQASSKDYSGCHHSSMTSEKAQPHYRLLILPDEHSHTSQPKAFYHNNPLSCPNACKVAQATVRYLFWLASWHANLLLPLSQI